MRLYYYAQHDEAEGILTSGFLWTTPTLTPRIFRRSSSGAACSFSRPVTARSKVAGMYSKWKSDRPHLA